MSNLDLDRSISTLLSPNDQYTLRRNMRQGRVRRRTAHDDPCRSVALDRCGARHPHDCFCVADPAHMQHAARACHQLKGSSWKRVGDFAVPS